MRVSRISLNRRSHWETYLAGMSFVVRHKGTGYYLQSHQRWTNELDSALRFNSGLRLVNYVERGGLREKPDQLEVVVISGSSHPGAVARA